jgi:hypothetical protein
MLLVRLVLGPMYIYAREAYTLLMEVSFSSVYLLVLFQIYYFSIRY